MKSLKSSIFINSTSQFHTFDIIVGNLSVEQAEPMHQAFNKVALEKEKFTRFFLLSFNYATRTIRCIPLCFQNTSRLR